jgi:hypothetical protein
MAMAKDGVSIKQIVRQTGHSRKTVRQVIRGARADVFRSRMNSLEPYLLFCRIRKRGEDARQRLRASAWT